jgi:hypothetical protein
MPLFSENYEQNQNSMLPAIIGGASSIIGGLIGASSQRRANRENMRFTEQMYNRQRADNLFNWHLQNSYNHPSQQRKRLEDAGFNSALMYGKSASSGVAGQVQGATPQNKEIKPQTTGQFIGDAGNSVMNSMYDLRIKAQQAKNLKKQESLLDQDILKRSAELVGQKIQNQSKRLGFNVDTRYLDTLTGLSVDAAEENIRGTMISNRLNLDENERRWATTIWNVREAATRILNHRLNMARTAQEVRFLRQRIQLIKYDKDIKRIQNEMWKRGQNPSDPAWQRILGELLSEQGVINDSGSIDKSGLDKFAEKNLWWYKPLKYLNKKFSK